MSKIYSKKIEIKTNQIKANITREQIADLKAYGIDFNTMLIEYEKQMLREIRLKKIKEIFNE